LPLRGLFFCAELTEQIHRGLAAIVVGAMPPSPRGRARAIARNHWFIATPLGSSAVPEGLNAVTPFVHLKQAAPCIDFLERAFGAIQEGRHDAPDGRVMYARLRIGNAAVELGEADADAMPATFYLYVDDADALYERAVTAGAKSLSAPTDQWYGERVGSVEDAMGNQWFIARSG
jgi:PhnB protein